MNIIALEHNQETTTEIGPNTVFHEGDSIVVIGKRDNIHDLEVFLDS